MKKVRLLILIIFAWVNSYGHTYIVQYSNIGNVYYSGRVLGESFYQNEIIAFLCNKFITEKYPDFSENVFLEIGFENQKHHKIMYGKHEGIIGYSDKPNRSDSNYGIKIISTRKVVSAESVLKLLEFGINNFTTLKESQIDTEKVELLLNQETSENIRTILDKKVYRNLGEIAPNVNIEYYFQNDKFYFIDFMDDNKVFLETNQIHQIISEHYLGSLIFVTDSSGFFYNRETKKLSSEFTIKNTALSDYYRHTSTDRIKKRIYFEYEVWNEGLRKFIYLPEKLILIQEVEKFEDELIEKSTKG